VRLVTDQQPTHAAQGPDTPAGGEGSEPAEAPGPRDIEALQIVEAAAAEHWTCLPDKPEMAVPTTHEGVGAVREALRTAHTLEPEHPDILARLAGFEATLGWAGRSRFAASLASPVGAVGIAVVLVVQAFAEGRLPGTRNQLFLYAAAFAVHALLLPLCARRSQLEVNARFLAGEQTLDERLVRWLLRMGGLVFAPGALLRALLYGLLIPISVVRHLVRRRRFLVAVLVVAADLGIAVLGHSLPRGEPAVDPEPFQPGVDIFGAWVPQEDPFANVPAAATRSPGSGWELRSSNPTGGLEASVWTRDGRLGDSMMRAWADDGRLDNNRNLQQFRSSAAQLEARWGPPAEVRSEANRKGDCSSRWITYERGGFRLRVKELDCRGERPSLQRNFSAPASRP